MEAASPGSSCQLQAFAALDHGGGGPRRRVGFSGHATDANAGRRGEAAAAAGTEASSLILLGLAHRGDALAGGFVVFLQLTFGQPPFEHSHASL